MEELTVWIVTHWLALIGAAISFVWVWLEYRASIWLWPVGIILPIFYIFISWDARFIGNIGINVYYLISSIIGWIMWLRGKGDTEQPIGSTPEKIRLVAIGSVIMMSVGLYFFFKGVGSVLPWADAVSTGASVVGMLLLGRKWLEHWLCWMVANSTGALVFFTSDDHISTIVFAVNFVMSIAGYLHWRKQYLAQGSVH